MPDMTGLQVQEELERRSISQIAIIFLTAHGDVNMAVHTMRHGAVDFMQKPADPHKLLARVSAAVVSAVEKSARDREIRRLRELVEGLSPREKEVARA